MSHFGPVAYTYDADVHCPEHAYRRFGEALDDGTAEDSEGNEPGAVFPWDENAEEDAVYCADCVWEEVSSRRAPAEGGKLRESAQP